MWIYKHKLFHRDHPEDLHLVRRRTCPGVDGRKQRFSRLSARKLSRQVGVKKAASSDEDESSVEEVTAEVVDDVESHQEKTELDGADVISLMKRSRRLWSESENPSVVDISTMNTPPCSSPTDRLKQDQISEDDDDASAAVGKSSVATKRLEMAQQSMVVSEVALKLEEYAKKAMKISGTSRTRRGGLGVVTPPFGSLHNLSISTRGLITYDDEYESSSECTQRSSNSSNAGVVSVGDESSVNEYEGSPREATCFQETGEYFSGHELFGFAPVEDIKVVKNITEQILQSPTMTRAHGGAWVASAAVTGFCMATPPTEDSAISSKILHLISSCPNLASEFQQYRAALHPQESLSNECYPFASGLTTNQAVSIHQIWERAACRGSAVRDFKTFAVNTIHMVMSRVAFDKADAAALERTADIWLKSVGGKHLHSHI